MLAMILIRINNLREFYFASLSQRAWPRLIG